MNFTFYKDENVYEEELDEKIICIRKNIMDWYDFKENSKILEIGTSKEEFLKIEDNQKYDYILLIGTLEYANLLIESKNPYTELLSKVKELLKPDGKIIIAVDNSFGVKYLVGDKSKHCEKIFDSLKSEYSNGKLFSKQELNSIIGQLGFKNVKYYYPLPDYKYTSIIFSDDYLPYNGNGKINYIPVYDKDSIVIQNEVNLIKQFINKKQFEEFTNSYLIELSNDELQNTKFVSFNNSRCSKYSLMLKFEDEYFNKYPQKEESIEHIRNIKNNCDNLKEMDFNILEEDTENDIIKSRFSQLQLFDSILKKLILKDEIEKAKEMIDMWILYVKNKLGQDENGNTKNGYIDIVFENTFFDDKNNNFVFFDQEWNLGEISLDFIIYRAIKNFYIHNMSVKSKINIDYFLKKYNLLEKVKEYDILENEFQEKIIDKDIFKFYESQYQKYRILEEMQNYETNLLNDNKLLKERIVELEDKNDKLKKQIEIITNSKSWRYTKFLRKEHK